MFKFRLHSRKCPQPRVGVTSQKVSKVPGKKEKNSKMVYEAVLYILRTSQSRKLWVNTLVKMVGNRLHNNIAVDRHAVQKALHRLESRQCVHLSDKEFVCVTDHFFADDIEAWKNRFLGVPAHD